MKSHDAEEDMGMRKILAQSPTCTPARKFHQWRRFANPKIVYMLLLFQIL